MEKSLFPYKYGDVQAGNWQWAVGSEPRYGSTAPYCVASINFHGCIAAGYDPEKLAPILAEAPAMVEALRWLVACITRPGPHMDRDAALEKAESILARIDAAGRDS